VTLPNQESAEIPFVNLKFNKQEACRERELRRYLDLSGRIELQTNDTFQFSSALEDTGNDRKECIRYRIDRD
jgi:hypothetical protein